MQHVVQASYSYESIIPKGMSPLMLATSCSYQDDFCFLAKWRAWWLMLNVTSGHRYLQCRCALNCTALVTAESELQLWRLQAACNILNHSCFGAARSFALPIGYSPTVLLQQCHYTVSQRSRSENLTGATCSLIPSRHGSFNNCAV